MTLTTAAAAMAPEKSIYLFFLGFSIDTFLVIIMPSYLSRGGNMPARGILKFSKSKSLKVEHIHFHP